MRTLGLLLVCLALAACTPPAPMPVPAPVTVTSPLPPAQAVQRAAQRLVMDGFTITTSDATGGVLTASLVSHGAGSWGPLVACRFGDESSGHVSGTNLLTVRLVAQAVGGGSSVYLSTTNRTDYAAGTLSSTSMTDCASSGEIEKRLTAALTAP